MGEKRLAAQKGNLHSATVGYLTRISELELSNSELEVEAKVAKAENAKLREQARLMKSDVAKLRSSELATAELTAKVREMMGEIHALRAQLAITKKEKEEMGLLLRAAEKELAERRQELEALKAKAAPMCRTPSEFPARLHPRDRLTVSRGQVTEDPSERHAFTEVSQDLMQYYNFDEVNEDHSPNRPYRSEDLLFASEGKRTEERREMLRPASAYALRKQCISRASTKGGVGPVQYVPSSLRMLKKQKLCDATSHVNVPRVSEIRISPSSREVPASDAFLDPLVLLSQS